MTPLKILQNLFEVRDQIHLLHWHTTDDPEHRALGAFYEQWIDLTDKFVETYLGKYDRIEGVCTMTISTAQKSRDVLIRTAVFLNGDIQTIIDPKVDSDLENIIADMKQLVNHTLYLLTLS